MDTSTFTRFALFVAVLIVLKLLFGRSISIIGSVLLTVGLSLVISAWTRR